MSGGGYPPRNAAYSGGLQQPYHNHDGMNQFGNAFVHSEQKPGLGTGGKFPPTSNSQPQKALNAGVAHGQPYAPSSGVVPGQPSQYKQNSYPYGPIPNSHPTSNATVHPNWTNAQQPGYVEQPVANGPLSHAGSATNTSFGQSPGHRQGPATTPPHLTAVANNRPIEPVGPHPNLPHPGSAFTSVSPSHSSVSAVPPAVTNSVSNAAYHTAQHGVPATGPYSMSSLGSGKPQMAPAPMTHSTGGAYTLGGAGTPSSSGPPTPTHTPTPPPGQEGQAGRPLASRRRQYPAQTAPPAMPGQAGLNSLPTNPGTQNVGYPGQMPASQMQPPQGLTPPQYRPAGRSPGGSVKYPSGGLEGPMGRLTVQAPRGSQPVSLMEQRHILPSTPLEHLQPQLSGTYGKTCSPSVLCCTLNAIPETKSLLTKSKLPLGIHLHPFKDLQNLPVIHSSVITRCRSCRTYINPFVTFIDSRRWRCSMCFRTNDVPEDFCYDPTSRTYGDPSRRPEIKSATVEFIAPSEYMLRPPQPLVLLFILDVSFNAIETGYLHHVCQLIKDNLDSMPGDSRTMIGFMTFNDTVHFYNLKSKLSQPQMLIVSDLDDIFLPSPDDLLVNLKESKELVTQLLDSLPDLFRGRHNIYSATGAALQAAFKLISPTGGRITLLQTTLPNIGPGALKKREDLTQKSSPKDVQTLTPATDFYKKFALDCAAEQVAVDLFLLSGQYADIASLMCAAKYSGGCVSYYPEFHTSRNLAAVEKFEQEFERYLTRKIGLEAVMRVRCTRGLSIHTFHGNFFVRSTDLVSLPNVNPDTGFSMQMDIEDSLTESNIACFQSALLYTSSKGERRIRVHTMAIPITTKLSEVYATADPQAITTLLAKMAVDRTLTSSLGDAREALMNASLDFLSVYRSSVANQPQNNQLITPHSLRLLPLFVLALLKHLAFRLGSNATLDTRCYAMQKLKTMPLSLAMLSIYPRLYPIHDLSDEGALQTKAGPVPQPPIYHLSGEKLSRKGVFLMDVGQALYVWVGKDASTDVIQSLFNVPNFSSIPENLASLPELDNPLSERARTFIGYLQSARTCYPSIFVIREDSRIRMQFLQNLVDDRSESVMSYYEYLVHLQKQLTK